VTAILAALGRHLANTALSVFVHLMLDAFKSWQASEDARARGRAEVVRDMTAAAIKAERDMAEVELPEHDEVLRRLREGTG